MRRRADLARDDARFGLLPRTLSAGQRRLHHHCQGKRQSRWEKKESLFVTVTGKEFFMNVRRVCKWQKGGKFCCNIVHDGKSCSFFLLLTKWGVLFFKHDDVCSCLNCHFMLFSANPIIRIRIKPLEFRRKWCRKKRDLKKWLKLDGKKVLFFVLHFFSVWIRHVDHAGWCERRLLHAWWENSSSHLRNPLHRVFH